MGHFKSEFCLIFKESHNLPFQRDELKKFILIIKIHASFLYKNIYDLNLKVYKKVIHYNQTEFVPRTLSIRLIL